MANYQTALMRTLVAIYNGGDPREELTTLQQQQAKAKAADQACGVWGDTSA